MRWVVVVKVTVGRCWVGKEEESTAAPTATPPAALCPYDPGGHALVIDATTAAFRFFSLGRGRGRGRRTASWGCDS